MIDQPDLFGARTARDEALSRVMSNAGDDWQGQALGRIKSLDGWVGIGESLRLKLINEGLPQPHNHNAWGALTRIAIKRGYLRPTGIWENMRTKKSHARMSRQYRIGG